MRAAILGWEVSLKRRTGIWPRKSAKNTKEFRGRRVSRFVSVLIDGRSTQRAGKPVSTRPRSTIAFLKLLWATFFPRYSTESSPDSVRTEAWLRTPKSDEFRFGVEPGADNLCRFKKPKPLKHPLRASPTSCVILSASRIIFAIPIRYMKIWTAIP